MKCWHVGFMVLQTTDTFKFVYVSCYFHSPCVWADFHVWRWRAATLKLGEMAAKPETTVQDSIATSVSWKPLDIFNKSLTTEPGEPKPDLFLNRTKRCHNITLKTEHKKQNKEMQFQWF